MAVLNLHRHELGFKKWGGGYEIHLVARGQVALDEPLLAIAFGPLVYAERIAQGLHGGMRHDERLLITLHASWHHDGGAHQGVSWVLGQQLLLKGVARIATGQKFVKRNHSRSF